MKKYFLHLYGQSVGPYSFEELRTMNLAPTTPVWYDGLGNWRNANQIPELQSLFVPNPQAFYQQQSTYSQPTSRSTSFANTNLSGTETPKGKSKAVVIILMVLVLVLGAGGFFVYNIVEKKKRMSREIDEMIRTLAIEDSIKNVEALMEYDSMMKADSLAMENDPESTGNSAEEFVGNFNNYSGGTVQVTGRNDQNLKIKIKFVSETGEYCTGEVSGTGARNSEGKIIMRTDEGCKITMTYTGSAFISVEESYNCKSLHGKGCNFEGVYLKE